ncbi:hypothetical protein HYPSUDRAFT_34774 [Hypholoma sublateritium FD-334 SS-4]|uniref:Uncharacterized protein n=1 Tax=Hypholoma sublateritium (strain FD-334 SS-4) TaxID=945553 RepID=A0A0D2PGI9_HYPSF|nr:hypothetical protein HYPSUDRAFT_34774 [Hypholoma sublateritium FD-334 SS-4]
MISTITQVPFSLARRRFVSCVGAIAVPGSCGTRLSGVASPTFRKRTASYGSPLTHTALELTHLGSKSAVELTSAAEVQFTPDAPLCVTALYTHTVNQHAPDSALPALLSRLRCPALTHLSLTCNFLLPDCCPAGAALSLFLSYSGAHLEELTLDGTGIGPVHLAVALTCAPRLARLVVRMVRGEPAVTTRCSQR